ncbi:CopD family protein [Solibacillus sp. FSL R7-0682]|uniref:copper resistance D family protein n=1 Tax=Solibacillus sp. FSL R7-0682 TaxID=2921690 RepID=UPI0030F5C8D9
MITILISISQFLLYISFAVLMGSLILKLIPSEYKPTISIREKWLYISAWSIPVFTFVPIIQLLVILQPQFGLIQSLQKILFSYKMGHAWLAIVGLSLIFVYILHQMQKSQHWLYPIINVTLLVAIQAGVAYASHASSMDSTVGFFNDWIHLIAVSCWFGVLLILSFFTLDSNNWEAFLKWFTPLALVSVTAIALSGVFLTETIVPAYVTGWSTFYGLGLFVKHVLLVPLAIVILANGLLIKLKINKKSFNPVLWVKLELAILFSILAITAIFSEHQPPMPFVQMENVSSLFQLFYTTPLTDGMIGHFQMTAIGLVFFLLTALFIALLIISYVKEAPLLISVLMILAIALCFYFGFISITVFNLEGYCVP